VTAGVGVWVVGQAFINIAVVLGVLPVLGVPLPLISAGGTSLIAVLLAIGVVLSFARERSGPEEPEPAQTPRDRSRLTATTREPTTRERQQAAQAERAAQREQSNQRARPARSNEAPHGSAQKRTTR